MDGWRYLEYLKTEKNGVVCEELLSKNDFEVILAIFCFYDYGANSSEEVQKITTDQKDYNCSSCVILFQIAKIYVRKAWLVGHF